MYAFHIQLIFRKPCICHSLWDSVCYENMAKSFKEVFEEINTVISEGEIIIEGEKIKLEFFLGGDYKVLVILLRNPQKILLQDL